MDQMKRTAEVFEDIVTSFKDFAYAIEDGCVENHIFEAHKRGTNWIATVTPNRAAPGGLDRTFWRKGSGRWYAAPAPLKAGDLIEFAGDYTSGRGNKTRDRSYVLVLRVDSDHFVGVSLGERAPTGAQLKKALEENAAHLKAA
jgi:hypothetical protein